MNTTTTLLALEYARVMEACAAYVAENKPQIFSPQAASTFIAPFVSASTNNHSQEAMFAILLDAKKRVVSIPVECTKGLLDQCPVAPAQIFKQAIVNNAYCIILAHNHPSGDSRPSLEDINITKRLVECAKLLGIPIIDHVILGKATEQTAGFTSLREQNILCFD